MYTSWDTLLNAATSSDPSWHSFVIASLNCVICPVVGSFDRGIPSDEAAGRERVERELRREVDKGHVLYGIDVNAVAARNRHCDDVLFALRDGRFALVHLSYPGSAPDRPPWPDTYIFDNWDQAAEYIEEHADSLRIHADRRPSRRASRAPLRQ